LIRASGFHKASVHLYATFHGCVSSNVSEGVIEIKLSKKGPAPPNGRGGASAAADESELDYKTRVKLRLDKIGDEYSSGQVDAVRYGQKDWKERYYASKLRMPRAEVEARRAVVAQYVQGLCWVLLYYYQGVQDWGWYYPHHYAPCASDLIALDEFANSSFELGAAFSPFEQLMAVFPPASGHALPETYRKVWLGLHKIFVQFNAFMKEPIIIVLPLPPVRPKLLQ